MGNWTFSIDSKVHKVEIEKRIYIYNEIYPSNKIYERICLQGKKKKSCI